MTQVGIELQNVTKEFPARGSEVPVKAVDTVSLQINEGEFFALLGPSGCGKTTTLRMIAGFEEPTNGEILIRGRAVQGVPPFHRPVNTVFQDYALFPHMTVLQNVMFGLEMEGIKRDEAVKRSKEALEMVRLTQFDRRPRQLSGGQQQRVALARALVKRPAVLLLDEPLGALDLKLRKAMQYELMTMQSDLGITFVYVTHDQEEALTMCDRIAVMDHGNVLQVGRPEEIYEAPRSRFVADFIGETNFLPGQITGIDGQLVAVQIDPATSAQAVTDQTDLAVGGEVTVAVRPEKITIIPEGGSLADAPGDLEREASKTAIPGEVAFANYIGTDTRYIIRIGQKAEVVVRMQNFGAGYETIYKPGTKVTVYWANANARVLLQ